MGKFFNPLTVLIIRRSSRRLTMAKKKRLDTKIVSVRNIRLAHRRQLPAVLTKINQALRNGKRSFVTGSDFTDGLYPYVVEALTNTPGLAVVTNAKYGRVTVWLPGEPISNLGC